MKTQNKIQNMISESAIKDVRNAYDMNPCFIGDWIYDVDPETMEEVKSLYKEIKGSLFGAFCKVLKYSNTNNIKF